MIFSAEATIKTSNLPEWLKTNYRIKKEIRRIFGVEIQKQMSTFIADEEQRMLYGDSSIKEPVGIMNAFSVEVETEVE